MAVKILYWEITIHCHRVQNKRVQVDRELGTIQLAWHVYNHMVIYVTLLRPYYGLPDRRQPSPMVTDFGSENVIGCDNAECQHRIFFNENTRE